MASDPYTRQPYRLDAGKLGHLNGLTLLSQQGNPILRYFGGIPYALPPVGPYRFRQPRRLPDHFRYGTSVSPGDFTHHTAVCPQPTARGGIRKGPQDEDCLQLNIHIPIGTPPRDGWPVLFYIHGGFLQWGDANYPPEVFGPLLGDTAFEAIVVMPAYRLNAFGFITSHELFAEARKNKEAVGNMGFWDQRLALEWTAQNIGAFGGNGAGITVAGYSAGSHSAFQQLAHELYAVPDDQAVIRRIIMWSNSPGIQPKSLNEHQEQFDEVLSCLGIPLKLSSDDKLSRLRSTPWAELVAIQDTLKLSQFRGLSDGSFISKSLIADINSGDFARRMKSRGIRLMNGECRDEHTLYRDWRTPANTFDDVYQRLCADYSEAAVAKLCEFYCGTKRALPADCSDWQVFFGKAYANMQVHGLERGFHNALEKGGLRFGTDVLRYRFEWQTSASKNAFPPDWGVTHSSDLAIWFWGYYGAGLTAEEKNVLRSWNDAFASFVKGEPTTWGTSGVKEVKQLRSDGTTGIWNDELWDEGVKLWSVLNGDSGAGLVSWIRSKL